MVKDDNDAAAKAGGQDEAGKGAADDPKEGAEAAKAGGEEVNLDEDDVNARANDDAGVETKEDDAEDKPYIAVRKEIRSLSQEDQQRFANAVKRMMKNDNGKDSSEFYRVASYHGLYCAHRNESFPVWHRPYLVEFERALQEADKKLGNDGKIALPYWDWTQRGGNELIPNIIRKEFPNVKGLYSDPDWQLNNWDFEFPSDAEFKSNVEYAKIDNMVVDCLKEDEHFKHASATAGANASVESPHDRIHVASGWPMTSVELAAFNPLFYLHHCNVDRIFQKYLTIETDSKEEFERNQDILHENGREDLYEKWCEPFYVDREKKIKFLPEHGYGPTEKLGFTYNELPPTPGDFIREMPFVALFQNVDMMKLKKKSYQIHVFCQPKDEKDPKPLPEKILDFAKDVRYAGWAAIFGGRGKGCPNCETSPPVNKWVVLNDALFNLKLTCYDVKLNCICFDERGVRMKLEECAGVPVPKIRGPYFATPEKMSEETTDEKWAGDSYMIQKYLKKYGYYNDVTDGWFGGVTKKAVELFQKMNPSADAIDQHLKVDGIAGPKTKATMSLSRYDDKPDIVWLNLDDDEKEPTKKPATANYEKGTTVTYALGTFPGYLDAAAAKKDCEAAIAEWNALNLVKFVEGKDLASADLKIIFSNLSPKNDRAFDGRGGMLAESTKGHVAFDNSERWLTSADNFVEVQGGIGRRFKLLPVLLHEMGHVVGLEHSTNAFDVMCPYYNGEKVKLTKGDIEAAEAMYKN